MVADAFSGMLYCSSVGLLLVHPLVVGILWLKIVIFKKCVLYLGLPKRRRLFLSFAVSSTMCSDANSGSDLVIRFSRSGVVPYSFGRHGL